MGGTICPFPKHQFLDSNGDPLASALLFTYEAGTTTKLATYSDQALTSANANPIVLDAAGRATIFLTGASYKFVMEPSVADGGTDPPTSSVWTVDNVSAVSPFNVDLDVTGTAGVAISANEAVYLSDGSGGLTAGRWYLTDADFTYASTLAKSVGIAPAAIASGVAGSIRIGGRVTGLSGLTAGNVYYPHNVAGTLTSTAPTNQRAIGVADSTTSIILIPAVGANEITGPLPTSVGALPAISGAALTGVETWISSIENQVGNTDTGEDVLDTTSFAAGAIVSGDVISAVFHGTTVSNANAKTIRVRIDDGSTDSILVAGVATTNESGRWSIRVELVSLGSTFKSLAQFDVGPNGAAHTLSHNTYKAAGCTFSSNTVEFRLSAEATSTNDVVINAGTVRLLRKVP